MRRPSGTSERPWATSRSAGWPAMAESRKRIAPRLGRTNPAMLRIRVDLPAPFGPITATISPGSTAMETPRSATTLP